MDYDDNDTQGHNLQLSGEGRSKSSSVTRPYAFPRFDFEESIQGHLRFDNLVESEVFLDIQHQEDNQWIEDFSRASNVIEFSSSATESCSITRRSNVWSEATSLESVELLLKSVGQEQIVPKAADIDNSSTFDELGDFKKMEPKFENDNVNSGYMGISDASMSPDELLNGISGSETHVEGKSSQIEEITISEVHLVQEQESSSPMCMDILEEEHKAPVSEGDILLGTEFHEKNEQGVQCIVHGTMNRTEGSPSQASVLVQDVSFITRTSGSSNSQDQVSSPDLIGTEDLVRVAGDDTIEQLSSQKMADADASIIEKHKVDHAMPTVEVPCTISLSAECEDKGTDAEVINANQSSVMSCTQESQSKLLEDVGRDNAAMSPVTLGEGQAGVLSSSRVETAAITGNDTLTDKSENLNILNPENHPISEPKTDSFPQLDQKSSNEKVDSVNESSHKECGPGGDVAQSLSPSPLIITEDVLSIVTTTSADISVVAESLGFPVSCSSVELSNEIGGAENMKDLHDASPVTMDRSQFSDSAKEKFEDEAVLQLSNVCKSGDASLDAKIEENKNLHTNAIDTRVENSVAPTCDQAIMGNPSHGEPKVNQPRPDVFGNTDPETNVVPCKSSNDHIEKETNEVMHEQSFGRESSHADEEEGSGARLSVGARSLTLSRSDHVEAEVDSSCEAKFDTHHDATAEGILSAPDPLRASCSSPTIISPDAQLPDEIKQHRVGGSVFESKPSTSEDLKVKDSSGEDNSFTFKIDSLPGVEKVMDNNWTPFPIAAMHETSVVMEGVTTPDVDKVQAKLPQETSGPSPGGVSKTTSGRKRRASGKGAYKENSLSGFNGTETTPDKPARKRGNVTSVSLCPVNGQPGVFVGLQPYTQQKSKNLSTTTSPLSDLPDLNALALKNHTSPSTTFQQSFTDLQQVQLRAQIFVYGSLIQGTAPDEACMVSAFGTSDRERGVWQPLWQASMERGRSKKSEPVGESPMNPYSTGAKVAEIAGKQAVTHSNMFQSPVSRAVSKANPTTISSPIIPYSSPLWSTSTPYPDASQHRIPFLDYQAAIPPLLPYQISARNIVGHTTWPSQNPCSPNPWAPQAPIVSLNAPFTAPQAPIVSLNAPFTTPPVTEKMKLTPLKDLSFPVPPTCVKDPLSTPLVSTGCSVTVLTGNSHVPEQTKVTLSSPADSKPRRRKKSQASNDISLISQSRLEQIVASPVPTPAPLHVTTSMAEVSPACSIPQLQIDRLDVGTPSACSEETLGKVTDAKLQAEEAAVSAATAISHCEALWSQLAKVEPGTAQETEAKISAAAGAAAAAACVAKAAAAAARVASNAALQSKLMADEAIGSNRMASGIQSGTPASILIGDGGSAQSSSILLAAREATKRRIEVASAAAKQAENLDAIVKAAELAAEAVSQAGKIVAMGDPLPLKGLINAGPEGYWKLSQASSKLVIESDNGNKEQISTCMEGNEVADQGDNARNEHMISESKAICDEDLGIGKRNGVSDMVLEGNSSGDVSAHGEHEELGNVQENIIEGSIVEVYKDNDGLKPAWFSANVLTIQDGKAFVHYTRLLSKDGCGSLKEWVALESEGEKAPRIRLTIPITGTNLHGTKKRRRSAMENYTWTVKDMVDVNIQDSWWEGIITEKNENDEKTLTVHFPARGETSAVSVQQLRPSRIWSNGSWVDWSRLKGHEHTTESDTRLEKRQRLQSPSRSSKGKDQFFAVAEPVSVTAEQSKLQGLSATDKLFNIGKSTKTETKLDVRRTLRTGLHKEKSGVVIGVPKPGKKQKFREVSKHFSANQNRKENETKDPVKFAKYLIPQQGAAAHARKNLSRVDSKQTLNMSSFKSRTTSSRTVPRMLSGEDVEKSHLSEENKSNMAAAAAGSSSEAAETPHSSLFAHHLDGSFKKSSLSAKTELLPNKRKQMPFGGELTKIDEEKAPGDAGEPRRSHRSFQPTARLLEGLQSSSLAIPKMSSVSHDKVPGQKSRVKSASNRGGK